MKAKSGNEMLKTANESFANLANEVKNVITKQQISKCKRNKTFQKLYSDFLGEHVRVVQQIVKTQKYCLFCVSNSGRNNVVYDIQIKVSPDDIKRGD